MTSSWFFLSTHPILFVSRVEFMQVILAAAVRNSCPQDAVTILQYSRGTASYNAPFCGLIQGVSSRQRPACTVLPTAVMACHAQMYSRAAGRHFELLISYSIATLGLAYQSKTPNPGMPRVFNPLALELDIYSLAHHLCKM